MYESYIFSVLLYRIILVRAAMARRTTNYRDIESIDEADSPVEGLEEGTLAIRSNNKNITGIIWYFTYYSISVLM